MKLTYSQKELREFNRVTESEWLETNGLGGWAGSTVTGANRRRYHGLLIAKLPEFSEPLNLLSKLDETIILGDKRIELGSNKYQNAIYPNGHLFMQQYAHSLFPSLSYKIGDIKLKKTITAISGENTVVVTYEVLEAPKSFTMELCPLIAAREVGALRKAGEFLNKKIVFNAGQLEYKANNDLPTLFINVPDSTFKHQQDWYYAFEYVEEEKGAEGNTEDLYTPGTFQVNLSQGQRFGVTISLQDAPYTNALSLVEKERARRQLMIANLDHDDQLMEQLVLASDQFILAKDKGQKNIISGYHWLKDSARDALVSMSGICLTTGRQEEAKEILTYRANEIGKSLYQQKGNKIGELDAPLWLFHAAYEYVKQTGDIDFVRDEITHILRKIIEWYKSGVYEGVKVDFDGLLVTQEVSEGTTCLSYNKEEVRNGKLVELNALWYNAHKVYSFLSDLVGNTQDSKLYRSLSTEIKKSFLKTFWNAEEGFLFDSADDEKRDDRFRVGQLFAIALPFPVLDGIKARRVYSHINRRLYTSAGLIAEFDATYWHEESQKSALTWLLGFYIDATIKLDDAMGDFQAKQILKSLEPYLGKHCMGHLPSVYHYNEKVFTDCQLACSKSVGELLRSGINNSLFKVKKKNEVVKQENKQGEKVGFFGKEEHIESMKFANPFSSISAFRGRSSGRMRLFTSN